MRNIRILDCTLRDGGYCNQWAFGEANIRKVIDGLTEAEIDIIECGFISNKVQSDKDKSKFSSVEEVSAVVPTKKADPLFVAMINYGEYDVDKIPVHNDSLIDGIRVAFHKKNVIPALDMCSALKEKGYKVFIQAMVTMAYSDLEFLDLISKVNRVKPYAFYIVDSFGMMKKRDLMRFFALTEKNLDKDIFIGFHSHNNLQLAYSNALALLDMRSGRDLIIDSTVYGMGRGAGNLNTEIIIDHMNNEYSQGYNLKPILTIMDEVINGFYQQNPWGYSLPNYLSAVHNAHPNYAGYLSDKYTMTVDMMDDIFARMDPVKKVEYDKEYIEQLYTEYMNVSEVREQHREDFKSIVSGKSVLLIGPGKSSDVEKERIKQRSDRDDVITISVNFSYPYLDPDFIFVSNNVRFRELSEKDKIKCIITSNIPDNLAYLQVRYKDLLNDNEFVKDNSGLMVSRLMIQFGVKHIILAGFDGYSYDVLENYMDGPRILMTKKAIIDATNQGMAEIFSKMSKEVELEFLTPPVHFQI
ncbi:MAG: 3-hydroxy-3-methylglutaryl-CoA lyase [Thermoplasmata archaeon]|nr:3-hydroxy-3-methylglutaryl-CoA lyase [Thermoplasmata archaeon]